MENTWVYSGQEPIKIKRFLQSLGMGHRLFNDLKNGDGEFLVDRRQVRPTTKILPNQPLTIRVQPEQPDPTVAVSDLPLQVVYEDDNWLVVDKPAGVTSIPGPTVQEGTILNRTVGYLQAHHSADLRPHLITRLDRYTSGLMLIAKHRVASSMISQQVQQHQMLKEYHALVAGHFTSLHGTVDQPIMRPANAIQRIVDPNGQRAVTEYWVEQAGADWTLLRLRLHTGRTHQIRVHMAYLGHPLIGDHLYGGDTSQLAHQALTATKLSFLDPFSQEQRTFQINLSQSMKDLMAAANK